MTSDAVEELLAGYDPEERRRIDEILEICDLCKRIRELSSWIPSNSSIT